MGLGFDASVNVNPAHAFAIDVNVTRPAQRFHLSGTWTRSGTTVKILLRGTQVQELTYLGVRVHTRDVEMRSAGQASHFAVRWRGDGHVVFSELGPGDDWRADCRKIE
jgi:hypothetical protein